MRGFCGLLRIQLINLWVAASGEAIAPPQKSRLYRRARHYARLAVSGDKLALGVSQAGAIDFHRFEARPAAS